MHAGRDNKPGIEFVWPNLGLNNNAIKLAASLTALWLC